MSKLPRLDGEILNFLQQDFPLHSQPFKVIASRLDITEEEVLDRVRSMKQSGLIRRIGAVLDARSLGLYSTLCACRVPEERIDEAAKIINSFDCITHNYVRDHFYNVWFTLTVASADAAGDFIHDLEKDIGVKIVAMPSTRLYKIKTVFEMRE